MSSSKITSLICSISSNGEYAAVCTPGGVIKFYETLTSSLLQEFSSSCSCLSWSVHGSKNIESELNDLNLIAIGKVEGVILLYSMTKRALHSELVIF